MGDPSTRVQRIGNKRQRYVWKNNNRTTYLLRCQSRARVDIEDLSEQITNFFIAYVAGHRSEFTTLNLTEQIRLKLTKEGQLPNEDNVENDASRPDISSLPVVRLLAGQVRIHVVGGAAEYVEFLICFALQTEPEVDDLDVLRGYVHEDVVKLEVAVSVVL